MTINCMGEMVSNSTFYARISDANGEIAKLSLHKRHFQPGDNILGLVDFRDTPKTARICGQFSVSLVANETITKQDDPESGDDPNVNEDKSVQGRTQETCFGTDTVAFNLPIPLEATPTFATPIRK